MNTPAHILRNQMGHASINVTQRYYIAVSQSGIDILKKNLGRIYYYGIWERIVFSNFLLNSILSVLFYSQLVYDILMKRYLVKG